MLPWLQIDQPVADTLGERIFSWEHEGHMGIRKGKWKLVFVREFFYTDQPSNERKSQMVNSWYLFDLVSDPYENNDLSKIHPDVVEQLRKEYKPWAEKTGVVDWDKVNIW